MIKNLNKNYALLPFSRFFIKYFIFAKKLEKKGISDNFEINFK